MGKNQKFKVRPLSTGMTHRYIPEDNTTTGSVVSTQVRSLAPTGSAPSTRGPTAAVPTTGSAVVSQATPTNQSIITDASFPPLPPSQNPPFVPPRAVKPATSLTTREKPGVKCDIGFATWTDIESGSESLFVGFDPQFSLIDKKGTMTTAEKDTILDKHRKHIESQCRLSLENFVKRYKGEEESNEEVPDGKSYEKSKLTSRLLQFTQASYRHLDRDLKKMRQTYSTVVKEDQWGKLCDVRLTTFDGTKENPESLPELNIVSCPL